jgi:hypothetical protein
VAARWRGESIIERMVIDMNEGQSKDDFKKSQPCPSTSKSSGARSGYVIDHVTPLKRGGADSPSNMQWKTTAVARSKNKTE